MASRVAQFQIRDYEEAERAKKEAKVNVSLTSSSPNIYQFIFQKEGMAPAYKVSWRITVVLPGCAEIGSEMRSDFNENSAVPKRMTSALSAEALIFEVAAGVRRCDACQNGSDHGRNDDAATTKGALTHTLLQG